MNNLTIELSNIELSILVDLDQAWSGFSKLETEHPDEEREFREAIHKLQYIMGMRVARRALPEVFPTYKQIS